MERRILPRMAVTGRTAAPTAGLALALTVTLTLSGCDYSSNDRSVVPEGTYDAGFSPVATVQPAAPPAGPKTGAAALANANAPADLPTAELTGEERAVEKAAILDNVIKQIQASAINPGGNHFGNATKNLNQFFSGTAPSEYALPARSREFLLGQLPQAKLDELASPTWMMPDARHLEDCMMYRGIATRIAGVGEDLARVRRVFDWMIRQIQLVPPGSLGGAGMQQAYARPYDVLLRGMATESEGVWSERGWLFLALCRQLGLDAGLVTYTPPKLKEPIVWCVAVLIDGPSGDPAHPERVVPRAYLFDPRIGTPIPDARGDGVATLTEALDDPIILDRLDLPGQSPYNTSRAALLASPSKLGILIDSGTRYFSPRMKLLQQSLAGKNLTTLYRDGADQRDHWAAALGTRLGKVGLWDLPMMVETLLFTSPQFVEATQQALVMFRPDFPLLFARMKHLRGELPEAVTDYVDMRFKENATLMDRKTAMPPPVQKALDIYATYFLGMCHLDRNDPGQAERFFERTLQMLPEPSRGQPYYNMFRWGASANLARLKEARGDVNSAVAYYSIKDPTTQRHGNLLRARDLLWRDPTGPFPDPLPAAPPPVSAPVQSAMRPEAK